MASGYDLSKGNEYQAPYDKPAELTGEHLHALSVKVLFTTTSGTIDALRQATRLADQLSARIEILVPYEVPYPLPIDKPEVSPDFRLRQLRTLCDDEAVETLIDVRLCRRARQCIYDALSPQSLVLIGGREGWWPLSSTKCLARTLRSAGHQVLFVNHDRRSRAL